MATGQLGKAARISYESRGRRTGLTDIELVIQRPDGVDLGPFAMTEYRAGFYRYDFITALTDLEGDYLGFIESPTEGHSAHVKLSLFKSASGGGGDVQILGCEPLIGKVNPVKLSGVVTAEKPILGAISKASLVGQAEGINTLNGKVKDVKLQGVTDKEC